VPHQRKTALLGQRFCLPITGLERIDLLAAFLLRQIVPRRGKRKVLATIDDDPPGSAERSGHRKYLARWPGYDFGLEPAMVIAPAGVKLPGDVGCNAAQIPDQDIPELAIAYWATHWCSDIDSISNGIARGCHCHGKPTLSAIRG
jgi:hypothetical protein